MSLTALAYHQATVHDPERMRGGMLDFANQPARFKSYPNAARISLPRETQTLDAALDQCMGAAPVKSRRVDLAALASILRGTCAITAVSRRPGQNLHFRSAASAGALYPTELYVATSDVTGCPDGLHHYDLAAGELATLRDGSVGAFVRAAAGVSYQPAILLFITGVWFRSSWKYRDRAYRYVLLDAGHVAENAALALTALGVAYEARYDFDDDAINDFLGVDTAREGCLVAIVAGQVDAEPDIGSVQPTAPARPELYDADAARRSSVVSPCENISQRIVEIHESGKAISGAPTPQRPAHFNSRGASIDIPRHDKPLPSLDQVLAARHSKRNFIREACESSAMDILCDLLAKPTPAIPEAPTVTPIVLVQNVKGREDP